VLRCLAVVGAVGSAAAGASPNYWVYLAARIVSGFGAAGQGLVGYLAATEAIGPAWRGSAGIGSQVSCLMLAGTASLWHATCHT
jgi:predicted MFS family arabinose efflux permease